MQYMIEKDFKFEAAHVLPHHVGKCSRLHGHSWVVTVRVDGDAVVSQSVKQSDSGMLMDFAVLKKIVQPLIDMLDHQHLNTVLRPIVSPTCEAIAHWLFEQIGFTWPQMEEGGLEGPRVRGNVRLHSVTVHETCTSRATVGERLW
jgi:6-pyruvoyltetrahydropterin/6-carboxytetrahydropterin synthase